MSIVDEMCQCIVVDVVCEGRLLLKTVLQFLFTHCPACIVHGYQYICNKLMLVHELIKYCQINAGTMHG